MHALAENNFYWWTLGGWGDTRSSVEQEVDGVRSSVPGTQTTHPIHSGRWYDIRIVLQRPEKVRIREIPAASDTVFPAHSVTVMRFASGKQ